MSRRGASRRPGDGGRSGDDAVIGDGTDEKTCAGCGRRIQWRQKWAEDWDEVRWCSQSCRRRGRRRVDEQLENAVLELLAARSASATICPSEAARRVDAAHRAEGPAADSGSGKGSEPWRELMEPARAAARRLVAVGEVEITQKGRAVDPSMAKGAIRLRRGPRWTGHPPG